MPTRDAPISMYRNGEGLGIWEHRGKVAAVGIGHSPTDRRWDERPETSVGAYALIAAQKALDDAGLTKDDIDGLAIVPGTQGEAWSPRPIPEDFAKAFKLTPGRRDDGLSAMSAEWMVNNFGLNNVKFALHTPYPGQSSGCLSAALNAASQIVGDGHAQTVLVIRCLNNLMGRYSQAGANAQPTARGDAQWSMIHGWGAAGTGDAYRFNKYCEKWGKNHDMMAPFILNQRRNGRMFPEGWYYQHPEPPLTREDYLSSRWVAKPLCLHDADRPIQIGVAVILTTAERAKDMKQPPVYILNHAMNRPKERSLVQSLEECEASTDAIARKVYEGSGLTASDLDVFNPYDGFTLFTQHYLEAFHWHGVKRGEALDFYGGDITVEGPHPFSSSGGNNGNGRTRTWMHIDCIQQLRGQAGQRQVRIKGGRPETAVSGGPTTDNSHWIAWGKYPD